jgi:hypothetical protein
MTAGLTIKNEASLLQNLNEFTRIQRRQSRH